MSTLAQSDINLPKQTKVVIAMSGGVDSSVAAALLVNQGYQVIGMMMRLWSEPGTLLSNRCCTPDAMAQARRVAARLGIPFYAVDAQQVFHSTVVEYFKSGYAQGVTPNPCLVCNRHIRWEFLLSKALGLGADFLSTGHYARLCQEEDSGIQLFRAVDQDKDQSYVLHVLGQNQLKHAIFPLGDYTKPQVRQLARDFNLPVAERPESQDLCFLGEGDYRSFLSRNSPQVNQPGPIVNSEGTVIGEHSGLAFYTIGQRKGLGLASLQPLYVVRKNISDNSLVVGPREALGTDHLVAGEVNWISGKPEEQPFRAQVKIRYRAPLAWATLTPLPGDQIHAKFDQPLRDITPGQAAVFYDGDRCMGGGIIQMEDLKLVREAAYEKPAVLEVK